jgi:hypothetical protein
VTGFRAATDRHHLRFDDQKEAMSGVQSNQGERCTPVSTRAAASGRKLTLLELPELHDVCRLSIFSSCEAATQVKSACLGGVAVKTHSFKMQSSMGKQGANQSPANLLPS